MEPKPYEEAGMNEYFSSLPPCVRHQIEASEGEIATLGELMQIGEHLKTMHGIH